MYNDDLIRIVINLYNNKKINGMSINDILNYSNIARSTLYQWIHKYSAINYDQFIDRTIKLRSYNRETVYRKINESCIKDIIDYVSLNPVINVKKIKKMILTKHKVSINKNILII
jgi:transposase